MPTPTTRLRAVLQDPGGSLNTWGSVLNDQAITLLDEAIAGVEKITLTGDVTLSSANYATDQARNAALIFQGSPASAVTVTIPSVEKVYVCSNQTAQAVTLKAGGSGVTLAAGDRAVIWCDGTDCGLGSISATTVNGLIANAQLAGANLPGQTGNAGKFLQTDGSVPLWADVIIPDVAGGADATITTGTTLTAAASVVQSVDMSSNAQSVRLPAATSLTKGGRKFVILGVGNRTFGVRDNAGALLTVVPAGGAAELHLRDNSTAAGAWGVTGRGLEPALTLVDHTAPSAQNIQVAHEAACRLTDTLSIHFAASPSSFLYAVAVDSTPGAGTVGTWVLVDGTNAMATLNHCFRISDTQAIVFWVGPAAAHKAAVLTVDPATRAITVGTAASTTNAFLANVTFSGRPVLAQLTPTLYVVLGGNGTWAMAISVSGAAVTFGAISSTIGTTVQQVLACYRISDTQALAIYVDDSGTAGSPYSLRAAVLSVSGTTISVGSSAGANDQVASAVIPTCQLSATKYGVAFANSAGTGVISFLITVSGTVVSFGGSATIEAVASANALYTSQNANRFQPNLSRISDTSALLTYAVSGGASRHVVLYEVANSLQPGPILYSLFADTNGGNFPQTSAGFLAFSGHADEQAVFSVTINGNALEVTGTFADMGFIPATANTNRFGLSGGVFGIYQGNGAGTLRNILFHLFRFRAGGPPQYLGPLRRNNNAGTSNTVPVEIAANKVAMINAAGLTQPTATGDNVRLQIVEFASL